MGDILFILGAPRSGTSLTSRLLLHYFDFGMGPEGQWIVPLARRAGAYGDLEVDDNLRRLVSDIVAQNMFDIVHEQFSERFGWPVQITEAKVLEAVRSRTYAGVAYAALEVLAREMRRSRVGSKHPGFARDLDTLESLFGGRATYLYVIRDGRDVALSMMKQPWGQKSWYANARLWADVAGRSEAFRARLPADRFLAFRYEDLLRSPEDTCRAWEAFLGIPLEDAERAALVQEISGGARSRNYEKWRSRMSARDHRLYESVAGSWLERYGYERILANPRTYPWEHIWYGGLEYGRRAKRKVAGTLGLLPPEPYTPTDPEASGT